MNNFLKRHGGKVLRYKSLLLILVSLSVCTFIIGHFTEGNLNGVLINLSATFIGTIFTILVVDEIIVNQKEREYLEVYDNAKDELSILCNMMISYLREPFGFKFPSEQIDPSKDIKKEAKRITRGLIKQIPTELKRKMTSASVDDWKRLTMNIFLIRQKLGQIVPLYKDNIPPNVLGKLLSLKRSFENFDLSFGMLADLFINEQDAWPKNRFGTERNMEIRDNQINLLEKEIKEIFERTEELFKVLENWENKM